MALLSCCCAHENVPNLESVQVEAVALENPMQQLSEGWELEWNEWNVQKPDVLNKDGSKEDASKEDSPQKGVPKKNAAQQSFGISPGRGNEFSLSLQRVSSDQRVGLAIQNLDGKCRVYTVASGGVVDWWNKENPTIQIVAGDEIKEVNGLTDYNKMRIALLKQHTLHLTVRRK